MFKEFYVLLEMYLCTYLPKQRGYSNHTVISYYTSLSQYIAWLSYTEETKMDRFVQQAIAQVLTPIYEEQFHDQSYGFRPQRGAQQAILRALEVIAYVCNKGCINVAMNNERLAKFGLISMLDYYTEKCIC